MARSLFIDISDKVLNTYVFDMRKGRYELRDRKSIPISGGPDFPREMMPGGIEDSCLSLPLSMLNFRVIELPFSGAERIREVLPYELEGMILGGAEKAVFDSVVVGKADGKYQVLVVYAEKSEIKDLLGRLNGLGVDPAVITSLELRSVVTEFSPSRLVSPSSIDDDRRIEFAQAEMKDPSVNLRRGEFAFTRDEEKTRKSLRATAVLAVLVGLAVLANLAFQIISVKDETAAMKKEMVRSYRELFPQETNIMNVVYQLKSHMKELGGKEDLYVGADPLGLLWRLSRADRASAVFYEITAEKGGLVFKGEAQSLADVQKVRDGMGGLFDDVNVSDSKSSAQGKMLFTITAKEKRT